MAESPPKQEQPAEAAPSATQISSETGLPEQTPAEAIVQGPVQVDDGLARDDEGYGGSDGSQSYLTSLTESVMNYKYENGRRYHAYREGTYLMPNDDDEQDRMDMGHHIYRLMLGGELYLAPIPKDVGRVLDLGTGTGIWAIDFADEHPNAQVLGTDLSPIQPKWAPPNCTFEVDDFESDWAFRHPFDYIHARELGGCISDAPKLFSKAYDALKPGAWFEINATRPGRFLSDDGTHELAKDAQFWMTNICEGAGRFGKPLDSAHEWAQQLKDAGFVDVKEEIRKVPCGPWPKDPTLKEIGKVQLYQESQLIASYTPAIFSRVLGWEEAEIQVLMAKAKNDLKNSAIHLYLPVYFIWGRKPE
ncbi:methyltransferase domain-containing protein [Sarocladium implicatum]|nr:methyltransferase domain-containing protein [Sarocladium implicatum]